jgi:lipoprotein signal peptidase
VKKIFLFVAPLLFVLDILLKLFVFSHAKEILVGDLSVHVSLLPQIDFHLAYLENKGMAWGMFSSFQGIILFLRIFVIGFLLYGMFRYKSMQKRASAYLLIILGALANVIDTFVYGFVIDMLHFTFWGNSYGVFNIADAMIFIGAFSLIFYKEPVYAKK